MPPSQVEQVRALVESGEIDAALQLLHFQQQDVFAWPAQVALPPHPLIDFLRGLLAVRQGDLVEALAQCGDAMTAASEYERAYMEQVLRSDPRYAPLVALLLQGDADV